MITKPRTKERGRKHVSSTIRALAWEWIKKHEPNIAHRIKEIAYRDCGLNPPKATQVDPHLTELLKKVSA